MSLLLLSLLCATTLGLDNLVARTPTLAWSSWYSLNETLDASSVMANAHVLASSGMLKAGYQYMILDDGWEAPRRDAQGFLQGNSIKFPQGMASLVTDLNALGIALGLYTTPGDYTCLKNPGSRDHAAQDVSLWVEKWGVRYVKDCMCNTTMSMRRTAYSEFQAALHASGAGASVVFECDPPFADDLFPSLGSWCNLWAAHDDVEDDFAKWTAAVDDLEVWGLERFAGPGAWNLVDILRLGEGGQSLTEYRSQVSIYTLLASPLIAGTDLRTADASVLALYTAPEVLAIHQNSWARPGRRITQLAPHGVELWSRELEGGSMAIGVFNRLGEVARDVAVPLALFRVPSVGSHAHVSLRDVWARIDIPGRWATNATITLTVQRHECLLLRATVLLEPIAAAAAAVE